MKSDDPAISSLPKPLIELKGVPIVERSISKLVENGVEVAIVINKAAETVFKDRLKNYPLKYLYQDEQLGTANALFQAKEFVHDDLFLVLMGDDIIGDDLSNILDTAEPTVFGIEAEDVSNYGAILVNPQGEVVDIMEKRLQGSGMLNTGVYVMHKKFFEIYAHIRADVSSREFYITDAPKLLAEEGIKFKVKKLDFWFGVNTPEELSQARNNSDIKPKD